MFAAKNCFLTRPSAVLPVTFMDAAVSNNASLTLPTHAIGDVIVISAFDNSGTAPPIPSAGGTVPAWVLLDAATGAVGSMRTAYVVATATNHTSGTWTGASSVAAAVCRGVGATPIGGQRVTAAFRQGANAPSVTLTNSDGTSVLLHFYGHEASSWTAAPTGYTRRATGDSTASQCINTKDDTTTDGAIVQNTSGAVAYCCGGTVEVRAY
jgi:hypothetical protein